MPVDLVTELFDNLGRFAASYPLAPWRDDMLLVGTTMHGILMSARNRHRQAQLVADLTAIGGRIFCQRQLSRAADVSRARSELRTLVAQTQEPAPALPAARNDADRAVPPGQ